MKVFIVATLLTLLGLVNPTIVLSAPPSKPSPVISFGTPSPSFPSTTAPGVVLSTISVRMSDGSAYTGILTFTSPDNNGGGACAITGSAPAFNLTLGKTLTPNTYKCTVTASQKNQSASANITITITQIVNAYPIINLGTPSPIIWDSTNVGTPLSTVRITMSDSSSFTGSIGFGGTYGNGGGVCAISGTNPNFNLVLNSVVTPQTYHCTVSANQNFLVTVDITITVNAVTLTTTLSTPSPKIPDTTVPLTQLSSIAVTESDGSTFEGNLTFGGVNGNGGGACALAGIGTTLEAPTTATLVDSDGTWSFGTGQLTQYGYAIFRNSQQVGVAAVVLSYNGHTYAVTSSFPNWFQWSGSAFNAIGGDPRPGSTVVLGKTLTANTYICSIVATEITKVAPTVNLTLTVTATATPVIILGSSTPSIFSSARVGVPLSTVAMTMSDGSTFNGSVAFGGTYGDGSGTCALTGSGTSYNITLAKSLTSAGSPYHCTIVATQGSNSASSNITITVTDPTPVVTMNPSSITIPSTTATGTFLSSPSVTMPDGTTFNGTLAFGAPNQNGGGACSLSGGTGITIPPATTITDSFSNAWTVQYVSASNTNEVFENGVQNSGNGSVTLLVYLNNLIYVEYLQSGVNNWYVWNYSTLVYNLVQGDPRSPSTVKLGGSLTAGTYLCSIAATTQLAKTGTATLTVIVTGSTPSPIITFGTPSPSPFDNTPVGTPLSTIIMTMSDGSNFTGTLAFGGSFGNDGGICAFSVTPIKLILGKAFTPGPSTQQCTVSATQGTMTTNANITINVIGPTLAMSFGTPNPVIIDTTPVGQPITSVSVTVSDGTPFTGTLDLSTGSGSGGGVCALGGTGVSIPPQTSIRDSFGNLWTVSASSEVLENGVQNSGGGSVTLLLYYNNLMYVEYLQSGVNNWYVWNYSTSTYSLTGGDPRSRGSNAIVVGKTLTGGTFTCTVRATQ